MLRNLLGIHRKLEMDRVEYEALVRAQNQALHRTTTETRFSASLLCEMHRSWLAGIYEWAGKYRTVELSKAGFRWPPARLVARNMLEFETTTLRAGTPCREGPLQEVARRIAEVHAEFLLIHPFRDGNGRTERWLADLMALQAGYPTPDYQFEGKGGRSSQATYLSAVQKGYLRDYDLLASFFRAAIERRLRLAE